MILGKDKKGMFTDKLVSVVVPVYNVQGYLVKCVMSILRQTYQNIEIILVDDGSTDGSSDLCDKLKQQNEKIIVIHKENGGLVSARKTGITQAKGQYIINIDSDDWIEPTMISEMITLALENNADIVTSGCYKEFSDTKVKCTDSVSEGIYRGNVMRADLYKKLISNGTVEKYGILPYLVCKLIKRSLLSEVYLQLNDEIINSEDAVSTYSCCVLAECIVVSHNIYYHYVMRETSIVHRVNRYFFRNISDVYFLLEKNFKYSCFSEILEEQLDLYLLKSIFNGTNYIFGLKKNLEIPYYDFPKKYIPFQSKIVLYGAGHVGQAYFKQICSEEIYQLVGWVDKEFQKYQKKGMNVLSVEELRYFDYDYILIALKYGELANNVKKNLRDSFGIKESKILWFEPISIIDKYKLIEMKMD